MDILLLVLLHKSKHSFVSRSLLGWRLFGIPTRRHLRRKWGKPILVCSCLGMFMFFDNLSQSYCYYLRLCQQCGFVTSFTQKSISSHITQRNFPVLYFAKLFCHSHLDISLSKFQARFQKSVFVCVKPIVSWTPGINDASPRQQQECTLVTASTAGTEADSQTKTPKLTPTNEELPVNKS